MNPLALINRKPSRHTPHTPVSANIRLLNPSKDFETKVMEWMRTYVEERQGSGRIVTMFELAVSTVYAPLLDDFRNLMGQLDANYKAREAAAKLLKDAGVHDLPPLEELTYQELYDLVGDHADEYFEEVTEKETKMNSYWTGVMWLADTFLAWPLAANIMQAVGMKPGGLIFTFLSLIVAMVFGGLLVKVTSHLIFRLLHAFNWKTTWRSRFEETGYPENPTTDVLRDGTHSRTQHPIANLLLMIPFVLSLPIIWVNWAALDAGYLINTAGWESVMAHTFTQLALTLLMLSAVIKGYSKLHLDMALRKKLMLKQKVYDAVKTAHLEMYTSEQDPALVDETYSLKDWAVLRVLRCLFSVINAPDLNDEQFVQTTVAGLVEGIDDGSTRHPARLGELVSSFRNRLPGCGEAA